MKRIAVAAVLVGLGIAGVAAQSDPIKTRQGLMKRNDEQGRVLGQMARGRVPFDPAKADTAFANFADTAAQLPNLFPDNSKTGGDTKASPKIWENRADFDAKIAEFAKVVAENRPKVTTLDGMKGTFPPHGGACDNCYDSYRLH